MIYRTVLNLCTVLLLIVLLPNLANAVDAKKGKILFLNKCASCHNNSMVADMTGPALYGAEDRWKKYPGDIYKWIRNSLALAATGHPKAVVMVVEEASKASL